MKKILILGLNSYVGFYVAAKLKLSSHVYGISRTPISDLNDIQLLIEDSLNIDAVSTFIKNNKIDIVINCIGIGNLEQCESEKELAYEVNYLYVKKLVNLSKQLNFKLVHFSSNAVYCGDYPKYNENSPKEPRNYYGYVKALADDCVKDNLDDYLLIRVMTLFGNKKVFHRNNPGAMIVSALLNDKPLKLVNDLYGNLLFIDDLVNFVDIAIKNNLSGEYNISSDEIVNRYEFGLIACEVLNKPTTLITACSSDAFPSLAMRACNTSFDNSKVKNIQQVTISSLRMGIRKMFERMINEK